MATELTAEAVIAAKVLAGFNFTQGGHEVRWNHERGWFLRSQGGLDVALSQDEVVALIVDAMKREMGEDWNGCTPYMPNEWVAYYRRGNDGVCSAEAPAEAEAVIAAYKAWKEGK